MRLATDGVEGFVLGSAGLQKQIAPLLSACACGGRFAPGAGDGAVGARPAFDPDGLRPLARAGLAALESSPDPRLAELARVWRARALRAAGRESELTAEQQLELRLEGRLQGLLDDLAAAEAAGDEEAAETAHARYVELGSGYVQRFVRARERPASG